MKRMIYKALLVICLGISQQKTEGHPFAFHQLPFDILALTVLKQVILEGEVTRLKQQVFWLQCAVACGFSYGLLCQNWKAIKGAAIRAKKKAVSIFSREKSNI